MAINSHNNTHNILNKDIHSINNNIHSINSLINNPLLNLNISNLK